MIITMVSMRMMQMAIDEIINVISMRNRFMTAAGTMHMIPSTQLRELIEASGWTIAHWDNRRAASMPTLEVWRQRLREVGETDDPHFEAFRRWTHRVCRFPEPWAENNPLIDVVCVRDRARREI